MKRRRADPAGGGRLEIVEVANGDPSTDPELIELRSQLRGQPGTGARCDGSTRHWDRSSPLNRWLSPTTLPQFLARQWSRRFAHFPATAPDRFAEWLTLDRLGELLAANAVPATHLGLFDGRGQRRSSATPPTPEGLLDLFTTVFRQRGSLLVEALEHWDARLHELQRQIRRWTGHDASLNAYLTAGDAQTLGWHWDNHDVFVLQLAGEKHWTLYEPLFALPLATQENGMWPLFDEASARPAATVTLRPGDLLYLPRGVPHQARAGSEPSLHLTVALFATTWHGLVSELYAEALARCEQDLEFRRVVAGPLGRAERAQLQRLVARVAARVRTAGAPARLRAQALATSPPSRAELFASWRSLASTAPLDADTPLARTARPLLLHARAGCLELRLPDRKLILPIQLRPTLRWLARRRHFRLGELPLARRSLADAVRLVERLIDVGLIARGATS